MDFMVFMVLVFCVLGLVFKFYYFSMESWFEDCQWVTLHWFGFVPFPVAGGTQVESMVSYSIIVRIKMSHIAVVAV